MGIATRTGCLLLLVLALIAPRLARADSRTDFLTRMLSESSQFRVRAQAALAFGQRESEPAAVRSLIGALRDAHPAVRAASAAAVENLRAIEALSPLRAARGDKDPAVRSAIDRAIGAIERAGTRPTLPEPTGTPTYYVAVGTPSTQADLSSGALRALRDHMLKQVAPIRGVRLAPENEPQAAATSVLKSKRMVGYYLDSAVTKIEPKEGALRAQVSVIVGTYPGRAMRVMLSGAATVSGAGTSEQAKLQAAEAAFTGALRRLPEAMQAAMARAE